MLFSESGVLKRVVRHAIDSPWEVRKEAIWTIANICTTGTDLHVQGIIQKGGMEALCSALELLQEAKVILVVLDAIESVLDVGHRLDRPYVHLLDEFNGIELIEQLQEHPSDAVYTTTVKILEKYFVDEECDDENLAPATTEANTFAFGVNKQLFAGNESPQHASSSNLRTTVFSEIGRQ